jgi:hypothetical protein
LAQDSGPKVGIVDFYGLHSVAESKVRDVLGVVENGPLPKSKNDTEIAIEEIPGITLARMQAICCDEEGRAILYVGIEEQGAPHFNYRMPPADLVVLPAEIHEVYVLFLAALNQAVREGDVEEDQTEGHALMQNAAVRSYQEKFIELAADHLDVIRDVIRNSVNEEHRAIAAYVIGYAPEKEKVVDDLLYALRDSDDAVRDNAMRSLAAIEVLAKRKPTLKIEIPPTWLVEMLNSIVWTDRTAAAVNLVNLTEWRTEGVLEQLKDRALDSLIDMARWKHLPHALPAYILLGRVLGMEEEEIQKNWSSEDRLALVERASHLKAKSD